MRVGGDLPVTPNPFTPLNADVVAQFVTPREPTPAHKAKFRSGVRKQILTCTACERHKHGTPVPFATEAGSNPRFTVLTDTPQPRNDPAMKLLKALMRDAKIDPVDDVLWASVLCCPSEKAPNNQERLACRRNLTVQLEASYSPYVLLVGAGAVDAWRNDIAVSKQHGQFFVWGDLYVVMPLIHPGAALRDGGFKREIRDDLKRWHDVVYSGDNPLLHLGEECVKCGGVAMMWDRDGVPYCTPHFDKNKNVWMKEREKWMLPASVQLELM